MEKKYACIDENSAFFVKSIGGPIEEKDLKTNRVSGKKETADGFGVITWEDYEAFEKEEKDKSKKKWIKIAAIATGILLIAGLVFFFTNKTPDEKLLTDTTPADTVVTAPVNPPVVEEPSVVDPEPQVNEPEPVPEPKLKKSNAGGGSTSGGKKTIKLEGGNTYKGELVKGKPHGMGTMYYKSAVQISPKDLKKRMSEPGDYLIGEFFEGKLVQGKLYGSDNNVKEVIMVGR